MQEGLFVFITILNQGPLQGDLADALEDADAVVGHVDLGTHGTVQEDVQALLAGLLAVVESDAGDLVDRIFGLIAFLLGVVEVSLPNSGHFVAFLLNIV